jgi:hypothetical protein
MQTLAAIIVTIFVVWASKRILKAEIRKEIQKHVTEYHKELGPHV